MKGKIQNAKHITLKKLVAVPVESNLTWFNQILSDRALNALT